MPEIHAYRSLRKTVGRGVWYRLENPITPGLPDCLAIIRDRDDPLAVQYTWLEAKEIKFRKRLKVWVVDNFRQEQLTEITRLGRVGARVFLLLHAPKRRWMVPATIGALTALTMGVDDGWLERNDVPWQKALLPEPVGIF